MIASCVSASWSHINCDVLGRPGHWTHSNYFVQRQMLFSPFVLVYSNQQCNKFRSLFQPLIRTSKGFGLATALVVISGAFSDMTAVHEALLCAVTILCGYCPYIYGRYIISCY